MSNGFVAGFAARHDNAAHLLAHAFGVAAGFSPADIRERASAPRAQPTGFAPQPGPKHFSPADKSANPTEGWDPMDPTVGEDSFIDPLSAAHAAGYAEGLAAAAATAQGAIDRDRAMLVELAATLSGSDRFDRDTVATQLRQTVLFLVSKLVGETGVSAELLTLRIDAAIELLADSTESALLRVHPDDVALIEGNLPKTVFAAGDPSVARGSYVLESASTIVEDGPEMWLDQLAHAIERVAVPKKAA